jgi:hypothetical protein
LTIKRREIKFERKKKENDGEIIKKKSIEKMIPKKNSNQNKVG